MAPGQVQRTEIDVGRVRGDSMPGEGRLLCRLSHPGFASALLLLLRGGASLSARACVGLTNHPAMAPSKLSISRSFPAKPLFHPYHATNASYPRGGRHNIAHAEFLLLPGCCPGVTNALLGGEHRRMHLPRVSVNKP